MMKLSAALALVVLFGLSSVSGQFEDTKECVMHEQFVPLIVDCFVVKFQVMLCNLTSSCEEEPTSSSLYGVGGSHASRKLQSVENAVMQSNFLSHIAEQRKSSQEESSKTQQSVLDHARQMFLEVSKGVSNEHSGNKEMEELLDVLLDGRRLSPELLDLLQPVLKQLEDLRRDIIRIQEVLNSNEADSKALVNEDTLNELARIKDCFDSLNEEDFEDGLTWLRCLYICSDLPMASTCIIDSLDTIPACSRVPWVADLILRFFVDYMKLQQCYFDVISPTAPMELIEGRGDDVSGVETQFVEFRSYLPPGVHCFPKDAIANRRDTIGDIIGLVFNTTAPCVVQIQLTTSNYLYDILPYIRIQDTSLGRPRCRNGTGINQLAIGWHEHAVNASGIIVLERSNWEDTFRVPVVATVDHKVEVDNYTEVNFTIKMVVDGSIDNTTKILTRVYNRDVDESICQSINDPHIVTFDNRYYNNLYQGYFVFYKHSSLPYEVQLIYQSCGTSTPNGESCNCGVAVRSGDDVFVVDRCRLKPEACTGADCRMMKVTLFVNGDLTPGTRIFKTDGGLSYEVILPHGTIVKIKSNGEELINVWVIPSPYDRDNTLGLCGTFNVNSDDDFTLPNGTALNITDERDVQPDEFIQAWRVPPENRIFDGWLPLDEPFQTGNYCRCAHYVLSGIQCHCGYEELVETCDLALENEFTSDNLTSILRHSRRASNPPFSDSRDINETLVPQDPEFIGNEGTSAREYCETLLMCSTDPVLVFCRPLSDCRQTPHSRFPWAIRNAYEGCLDDYKITHNNNTIEWKMAATDAAKVGCLDSFERSPTVGGERMGLIANDSCINECYYRGICQFGQCQCDDGYTGADCGLLSAASQSPVLLTDKAALCDKRHEDCSFATIYGKNFTAEATLTCTATQIKVLDTETVSSSVTPVEVNVLFINLNQVACRLPYAASYRITLKQGGVPLSPPAVAREYSSEINLMAYDSVCYTCDTNTVQCTQKQDRNYCLVGGVCYANNQTDSSDSCKYCNSSYAIDQLYDSLDSYCVTKRQEEADQRAKDKMNQDIRIAVGCSLSALIIIISIVVFIITRRKEKQLNSMEKKSVSDSSSDGKITYENSEFSLEHVTSSDPPNGGSKLSTEVPANNNTISPYATDSPIILEHSPYDDVIAEKSPTTSSPISTSPPSTLVVKNRDLVRVQAGAGVTPFDRNRSSSIVSSSSIRMKDTPGRKESDAGSVGIGGGGPMGYGRHGHHTDQMGIGGHGMPISTTMGHSTVVSERL